MRFVAAVQSGNRTLAGTLFHSAAAREARALPASALPGGSALSYGSRREMTRHAGQLITNIGGQLTRQESRSWIDYVRPLMPNVDW
jgi:hypothetical protein